jgi:hypothetical protein
MLSLCYVNPDLHAQFQNASQHYEAFLRAEHDRETFRLASLIIDKLEPGKSIAELEKLGEARLTQIVEWMRGN